MIKHSRNMPDTASLFRNTQEQIVVLGTVELAAKPSLRQIATDDYEMAEVIVCAKKFRRPIGFQQRRRQFPVHDFVFVGINHIGFPVVLPKLDCTKQSIWFEQI